MLGVAGGVSMFAYRCVNEHCNRFGLQLNGPVDSAYCKCGDGFEVFQVPDDDEVDHLRAVNAALLAALRSLVKESPFVATETGISAAISFAQIKMAQAAIAKAEGRT